jgi:hypothetical protein
MKKGMMFLLTVLMIAASVSAKDGMFSGFAKELTAVLNEKAKKVRTAFAKSDTDTVQSCPKVVDTVALKPAVVLEPVKEMSAATDAVSVKVKPKRKPVRKLGIFRWQKIAGNPFGSRDPHRAFIELGLGEFKIYDGRSVVEVLEEMIKNGQYESGMLKKGDTLSRMISGEFIVLGFYTGVLCDWKDGRTFLAAQFYRIQLDDGRVLVVIRPDICFNWCYRIEPAPVFEEPPEDTIKIPPPETPDTIIWVPDTTPVIVPTLPPPPAPSLPIEKGFFGRLNIWTGHDAPTYNPWRHGANFYGAKGDVLYQVNSHLALGLTGMVDGWDGECQTGFTYAGFELGGGPMVLISFNRSLHLGLETGAGGQWNWGWGAGGFNYEYFQTNGFIRSGSSFDAVYSFLHFSTWGGYKWYAFSEGKESSLDGVQYGTGVLDTVVDPINDCRGIDGGARLYFWASSPVSPLIVWRESYAYFDHSVSTTTGIGVRFWEKRAVIELSFKDRSNSTMGNNGRAVEGIGSLSFGGRRGYPKLAH